MTIYPQVHQMEATVNAHLPSFTGHQIFDSTQTPPQSRWSDRYTDKNGMSITFKEVFQNFKENTKSADLIKLKSRPQSKEERIADSLNRTEKLLLSNDNARPQSRSKSKIEDNAKHDKVALHSHISNETVNKIFSSCNADETNPERGNSKEQYQEDGTNNAHESQVDLGVPALNLVITRKGKKPRKRNKSDHKARRIKPSKPSLTSTGAHNDLVKRLSAPPETVKSTVSKAKPRISSEPISSKNTKSNNVLSYTLQMFSSEKTTNLNKQISFTSNYRSASYLVNASTENVEIENDEKAVPSTHYTHGSVHANSSNQAQKQQLDATVFQIQPFATQKIELSKRIKSGHSIKSEVLSLNACSLPEKPSSPISTTNQFTLTAKSCHLPQMNTVNPETSASVIRENSAKLKDTQSVITRDDIAVSKESTLSAIYGPQNNVPSRAFSNADDFRRIKKIFLSERQSGTLKESGMEYPCAPPATPMPDVMRRYEYIPCMNDIRSQRAVKTKLQVMEREAQRKKDKQKEANAKLEKQQSKDKEKSLKIRQRREIYALNKIMTELEHKRFLEFCHSKGLNT